MFDIREGDSILSNKNVGIITNIQLDMIARKQYKVHWANGQVGWLDHNTTSQFRENYLQYGNQSR
jgi:hypothetical protein